MRLRPRHIRVVTDAIIDILEAEDIPLPDRATAVMDRIFERHGERVLAMIYYGSSGRESHDTSKMLDFYVLVDSYRKTHGPGLRAVMNRLLPPAVYYLETPEARCKYSVLSLREFEKRCTSRAFLSQVWGRFSQPCRVVRPASPAIAERVQTARAQAVRHLARETLPLVEPGTDAVSFWARGYYESYRTELRPEAPLERAREIVLRHEARYAKLFDTVRHLEPNPGAARRWAMRRVLGKAMTALRVINSAATFDGGLDYVLHKVRSHSGVSIEPTPSQHRHPVLWSPVLAWKLWRRGAFR